MELKKMVNRGFHGLHGFLPQRRPQLFCEQLCVTSLAALLDVNICANIQLRYWAFQALRSFEVKGREKIERD